MAIAIIHSSITQRRIFRNLLRKANRSDVCGFETIDDFLTEAEHAPVDCVIVQKEIFQETTLLNGQAEEFEARVASTPTVAVSYQFTQTETIELVRGGIDTLLLMPFAPETFYEKLAPLLSLAL